MWMLYCSIIIFIGVLLNCVFNCKVILPKLKYFFITSFFGLIIIVSTLLYNFNYFLITIPYLQEISLFFFICSFIFYLEQNYLTTYNYRYRLPFIILSSSIITVLATIYCLIKLTSYFIFMSYYDFFKEYIGLMINLSGCLYLLIAVFLYKNKSAINIALGIIILGTGTITHFAFSNPILPLGISLSLLFTYNGVENNINYFDSNNENFGEKIFYEKFNFCKLKKKEILMFVRIDEKNINKNIVLRSGRIKFYKLKRNLFCSHISKKEYARLFISNFNNLFFYFEETKVNLSFHIYLMDKSFNKKNDFTLYDIVKYLHLKEEKTNFKEPYELTIENDGEGIRKNVILLDIIQKAVNNDGFEMFYQPIYSTKKKKYISCEALIRLKDKQTLGFISPELFIPIAEKNGYADKIGNIVFNSVCSFYNQGQLKKYGLEYIELNVSGLHIIKDAIIDDFSSAIKKNNLNCKNINIEVTETAEISDIVQMNKNLSSLRKLGFKFSMDDFGSGYSNMMNIITNNYELIKIDKSIVWGALKDNWIAGESDILLKTCINLAHSLKREIVAEGVEDEKMVDYLTNQKVEYLQGYYFSKPLCEKDFVEFLKNNNK